MESRNYPKLLFFFFSLTIILTSANPLPPNPEIDKICKLTDYPDVCISQITPFLKGKTDPTSVVGVAIQAAAGHTKKAVSLATKLATSRSTLPQLKSVISDCKDSYNDALYNFDSAMKALGKHDVGTMNSMLSAAITDFGDCDDWLDGQDSPLLDFNTVMRKMTSNSLAILSSLIK